MLYRLLEGDGKAVYLGTGEDIARGSENALMGSALTGAAVGSVIPVIGTGIGALVGGAGLAAARLRCGHGAIATTRKLHHQRDLLAAGGPCPKDSRR